MVYSIVTVFHSPGLEYDTCIFAEECMYVLVYMKKIYIYIVGNQQILSKFSTQFLDVQNLCQRSVSVIMRA